MEIVIVVLVVLAVGGLIYRAKNKPKSSGTGGGGEFGPGPKKPPAQN